MKYDAFISYPHKTGWRLAKKVQDALQQLAKPWNKSKALNIFRDENNLAASPHLWRDIEQALDDSAHFIILAGPDTVRSKWIEDEINHWLRTKKDAPIYIVHIDGKLEFLHGSNQINWECTDCIPLQLKDIFSEIPLYTNLVPFRDAVDVSLNNEEFKKEIVPLAAAIHGKSPEELASEHVTAYRKAKLLRRAMYTLVGLLGAFVLVLSFYLAARNVEINAANESLIVANNDLEVAYFRLDSSTKNIRLKDSLLVRERDSIGKQNKLIGVQKNDLAITNTNLATQLGFAKKLLEGYRDDLRKRATNPITVTELPAGYKSDIPFAVVYYPIDMASLKPEAKKTLNEVARVLMLNPNAKITVRGKEFYSPGSEKSQKISEHRSQGISDYLASKGLDKKRISYSGSGDKIGFATVPLQNPDEDLQNILNQINTCCELWIEVP
jgi:outer membrane protein OmpA-like peptidoglycan-associated protein